MRAHLDEKILSDMRNLIWTTKCYAEADEKIPVLCGIMCYMNPTASQSRAYESRCLEYKIVLSRAYESVRPDGVVGKSKCFKYKNV